MKHPKTCFNKIHLELTSADITSFLNDATKHSITLYELEQSDSFTVRFRVNQDTLLSLEKLTAKRGDKMKIIYDDRINKYIKSIFHRPVVLVGIFFILFFAAYLPTIVLFVQAEGNIDLSEEEIITAGEISGIRFGASKRYIRSEKVKNRLLDLLPDLQWAGVNTKGCVAVISVTERSKEIKQESERVRNIIASHDGIITSITLEDGTALCNIGQAVSQGQLLISGLVDCGLTIRTTSAAGEIFARTKHDISVDIPVDCYQKMDTTLQRRKISLLLGKKRINLWKGSGISGASCDRMYKEYYIILPGGFQLPFGISIDTHFPYQLDKITMNIDSVKFAATDYAQKYLLSQMLAGSIESHNEIFDVSDDGVYMTGKYVCSEMISRVQEEQDGV